MQLVQLSVIAHHRKLIGGFLCVRVDFTVDCVYWSSRKRRGDLSVALGGHANNLFYPSKKSVASIGHLSHLLCG